MSRWLLALLFAFGTVTFLTGCPAEEEETDVEEVIEEGEEKADEMQDDIEGAVDDVTE